MAEQEKKDIKCEILTVLNEAETRRGITRLQIVSWNDRSPMLEKREYWTDKEGNEKAGKAKGLNLDDLDMIVDQFDAIEKMMDKK